MAQQQGSEAASIVYFDGACPLCRREIAFYRKLSGAETVCWQDVNTSSSEDLGADLNRDQALKKFHMRRADGTLLVGAAAFAEIWRHLPLFRPLYWLSRLPGLIPLMDIGYLGFLKIRPWMQRRLSA